MPRPERPPRLRLFFALWPDAVAAEALAVRGAALARECGGKPVDRARIHMTAAFVGEVPADRLEAVLAVGDGLPAASFELEIDRVGSWKDLVWVGPAANPAGFRRLAAELAGRLAAAGLPVERREQFPHLTLVRRAERHPAQPNCTPVAWRAAELLLIDSRLGPGGPEYRRLARWALAPALPTSPPGRR